MEILIDDKIVQIDEDDLFILCERTWRYCKHTDTIRANGSINRKDVAYYLHREIMKVGRDRYIEVDHIDHDHMDNRKHRLRVCTKEENCRNRRSRKGSSSKYLGVSYSKHNKKWRAVVRDKYRNIHVGYFTEEVTAAKERDLVAKAEYGEFAHLNFR